LQAVHAILLERLHSRVAGIKVELMWPNQLTRPPSKGLEIFTGRGPSQWPALAANIGIKLLFNPCSLRPNRNGRKRFRASLAIHFSQSVPYF
jgi:hypothetical protein